jgi:hypothetical protein
LYTCTLFVCYFGGVVIVAHVNRILRDAEDKSVIIPSERPGHSSVDILFYASSISNNYPICIFRSLVVDTNIILVQKKQLFHENNTIHIYDVKHQFLNVYPTNDCSSRTWDTNLWICISNNVNVIPSRSFPKRPIDVFFLCRIISKQSNKGKSNNKWQRSCFDYCC